MTKEQDPESPQPLFALGQIVATPGALEMLQAAGENPVIFLNRHVTGDWGDLDQEDKQANDDALRFDNRIFSAYNLTGGHKIWVLTEWDRSVTTLLRPDEY